MKRGVIIILLFILLVMPFILAENETESSVDMTSKVDNAYSCLEEKLGDSCSSSLEDNVFSLLAIGKCKEEILANAWNDDECWPKSDCRVKSTAQAILALDSAGVSTLNAEEWLFDHNETPDDLVWYLEIESPEETRCEISYGGSTYITSIREDKKLTSSAGKCLSLSTGDWWLRVSPSCYDYTFKISCDEQFLTTLLYKKKSSSTYHVSETTASSSAEGTAEEKVDFKCFSNSVNCDYEGTLWAALVLDHLGYDASSYIPYLLTLAPDHSEYMPEVFLYLLTGSQDFRSQILLMQKSGKYWDESEDKFYDSALALLPFQYESPAEKSNTEDWLMEIQGDDGCWDGGNIRNNAFLLYSIWPRKSYTSGTETLDCEDSGYYCMPEIECEGNVLDSYACSGVLACCDEKPPLESCSDQSGEICTDEEVCVAGTTVEASDIDYGESCCIDGRCEAEVEGADLSCKYYGGTCRTYGCEDNEKQDDSYSCEYGDICCIPQNTPGGHIWLWILLIIILIILAVLGIIFRDKLRPYYYKLRSKFSKKPKSGRPGMYPPMLRPLQRRINPRRILPPSQRGPPRPAQKQDSEIDDVLKKLKDMGK